MTVTPAPARFLPGPDTPVIAAHRIVDGYTGPIARYAAPAWPLIPMNANPGVTHSTIHWPTFPDTFREEMRLAAWTLINGELPAVFLRERHPTWRSRQAPKALCQTIGTWCRLAVWLTDRGITTLSNCTTQVPGEYGRHVRDSGAARITVHSVLSSLTQLWVFDQLSGRPSGIGCPPWESEGVDDYLPAATPRGENATEAIAEQTMGPLLVWAIRAVEEFSDDILAAWAEANRLPPTSPRPPHEPLFGHSWTASMPTGCRFRPHGGWAELRSRARISPRSPAPPWARSTAPPVITAGARPSWIGPAPARSVFRSPADSAGSPGQRPSTTPKQAS
ncbi:hypothetical protein ACFZCY_18545 [Streptomyces sp. NPDC007983]|uniref:hypothetical protein n=1 Tax=Streptomyces sp. NPDC007983 TaxID=3364800 RepID=UPI0036ED22E0